MIKRLLFIRFTYWYGAILDLLVFLDMMISIVFEFSISLPNVSREISNEYQTGMGVVLMLEWAFLLMWADHKPMECKFLLLLTIIPIILGIMVLNILYTKLWITSCLTLVICIIAYIFAKSLKIEEGKVI